MCTDGVFFAWLYWNPPQQLFSIGEFPIKVSFLLILLAFICAYIIGLFVARLFFALNPTYKIADLRDLEKIEKRLSHRFKIQPQNSLHFMNKLILTKHFEFSSVKGSFFSAARYVFSSSRFQVLLNRCYFDKIFKKEAQSFFQSSRKLYAQFFCLFIVLELLGITITLAIKKFFGTLYVREGLDIFSIITLNHHFEISYLIVIVAAVISSKLFKTHLPPKERLWFFLDCSVVPSFLFIIFSLIGEFTAQLVLGKASHLPWAVFFGNPLDNSFPVPRHPVQIYEALGYLVIIWGLFLIRKFWNDAYRVGNVFIISGLCVFPLHMLCSFCKEYPWAENSFYDILFSQIISGIMIILFSTLWVKYGKRKYEFLSSMES